MADALDLPPEHFSSDERRRERREQPVNERGSRPEKEDDSQADHYHERKPLAQDELANYKRRRSASPPPHSYSRDRVRRCSPSRRSPPYKRSRREEDYAGNRRGTTHRGHDRRLGYDGPSPFDRLEMNGVKGSGYSSHERDYNRRSGTGRSNMNDGPYRYTGESRQEGLKTYKQFICELEDDILPDEAQRRYDEYKNEFICTQKKEFFEQKKDEAWLRDKYHPVQLEAIIQRRNEECREIAKEFTTELEVGLLDIGPAASNKILEDTEHASDEEVDADAKRKKHGQGPARYNKIDTAAKAPYISSDSKRISKDVDQTRSLARKLDSEKGIEGNILLISDVPEGEAEKSLSSIGIEPMVLIRGANRVKGYEGVELLDVLLTYLWRVHGIDYYGMVECKESPKGLRHVRSEGKADEDPVAAAEWEKKLDETWQARLEGQDPLITMLCKEKMETALAKALDQFVKRIQDNKYGWKYGCAGKGCQKLFHGPEYVYKHLKLKHPELVNDSILKVQEDLYFQNYMSDPNAPGGTPVMCARSRGQSKGSRAFSRADRRSRSLERYERGRGEEKFDREIEHFPSSRDYLEDASPRTMSMGQYEGGCSGIQGSEIPMAPPVLMPVPGAGPLGPFVPAPPELAMRLMRDQGGSALHSRGYGGENGGGSRDHKGRSRGVIDAPPMIIPFPAIQQDPRRLRSYRDLDAPDDEVAVIDYRSL